jgi:hypothetical protein
MTINHTVTRGEDEQEIELTVHCRYVPGCRGHRDKYGRPEEPDMPDEIEILSVTPDIELDEDEIFAIEDKAFDEVADEKQNALADRERDEE